MKSLGLDIGTTTICAAVMEHGQVLTALNLPNSAFLPADHAYERIQDTAYIRDTAMQAVNRMLQEHPDVCCIGVTGQMHGIVYLDREGNPVSPLYTWQDGRGDLPFRDGETYAQYLSRISGHAVSTGYGLVTHFYNLQNQLVPSNAAVFCTIHDYLAMLLSGRTTPVTDPSDGASFGFFRVEEGCFDTEALTRLGIDTCLLPQLAEDPCIGCFRGSIPVYVAIGDNQASFLGATGGRTDAMLVNMGTGGQFSAYTAHYLSCPGLETRPFPGGYLLVGSSLCGGRAYALLERFFRSVAIALTGHGMEDCYEAMDRLLSQTPCPEDMPTVIPLFQGTRQEPALRASVTGLSPENFTPEHMIWGMLYGMAQELHQMYSKYRDAGGAASALIGSGNGLRKNRHLQNCFTQLFGRPLQMSAVEEEAAAGAAVFAANCFQGE